jgi:cell division protein FtsZ
LINVDFSHIKAVMQRGGGALMTIGHGKGEGKALKAINQALNHPLLETINLNQAAGVIANFTGGEDLSLPEIGEALGHIQSMSSSAIDLIMGFNNDNRLEDRVQVILVITGLGAQSLEEILPGFTPKKAETGPLQEFMEEIPPPVPAELFAQTEKAIPVSPPPVWKSAQVGQTSGQDLDIPSFLRRRTGTQDTIKPHTNQAS